ncbi:hypothetical protein OEZ85_008645 [Tetradesmus obliquus]|uniref:protein-serine/threonine phosphatase n=2 Tax=Tetradesmus obliquus TaxID=3088 RepID=A0A383W9D0_TETOB|nr:hypothetical protein OEZ85_008645 [Tetradesmus obliquus]|eukprot:jgi/Sobl393_1/3262/SZX73782.1
MLATATRDGHAAHSNQHVAESGGETRPDGKVSYGYSLMRGKRSNMEDFHHAQFKTEPVSGESVGLFGVFDGHGGPNAADYVRSNLFINLLEHTKFNTDITSALVESFEGTDKQYLEHNDNASRDDGCTAVTAVVVGERLLVANVGDSRAVLSRGGKAVPMSIDHKPNSREERTRIEDAGGVVVWAGTWRVGGVLAVSRAFGDRPLKRYVIPTPDIKDEQLTSADDCLILASDGLWDVVSNQDAVAIVKDIAEADKAARRLVDEAYQRGSNDNISCVVLKFRF